RGEGRKKDSLPPRAGRVIVSVAVRRGGKIGDSSRAISASLGLSARVLLSNGELVHFSPERILPMRASLLSVGLLATIVLFGPAKVVRADDILDEVKRARKIAADKLDSDLREAVKEAAKVSKTNRKEAIDLLESRKSLLSVDRNMDPAHREQWLI